MYESTDDSGMKKRRMTKREVSGNRVGSNFFFRAVCQQSQYLLANGVRLEDDATKERLGIGFDKSLE